MSFLMFFQGKKRKEEVDNNPPGNDHISPPKAMFEDDLPFLKVEYVMFPGGFFNFQGVDFFLKSIPGDSLIYAL